MKLNPPSPTVTILVAVLAGGIAARALTPSVSTLTGTQTLAGVSVSPGDFETIAFGDSAEAAMLHQAYRTLATGDHDYKGHRVKAMHAIEAAAKLLGLDLSGDLKDRTPQPLSDDKMREARSQIATLLAAPALKDRKRVIRHLQEAVNQIDAGLSVR